MSYRIDFDWIIGHLENAPAATQLLAQLTPSGISISMVIYTEVMQGVLRNPQPQQAPAQFETFLVSVPIVPFSQAVADRCAAIRETLKRQKRKVKSRALDLIDAATALEHGLTLVTRT